jgi:hypothetical protein
MTSHLISRALRKHGRLPTLVGALAALTTLAATGTAAANANWSYAAPTECPAQAAFADAVTKRGASLSQLDGRTLAIALASEGEHFIGTLKLKHEAEPETERKVQGATCEEVADALAVVTAIAIRGSEAAPAVKPTNIDSKSAPLRLRATDDIRDADIKVTAGEVKIRQPIMITAFGGATFGLIPNTAVPRIDLDVNFTRFMVTPDAKTRRIGIIYRVNIGTYGPAKYRSSDGHVTNAFGFAGTATACLSPLYDTAGFVLLGCSGFGAGLMYYDTVGPRAPSATQEAALAMAVFNVQAAYNLSRYVHVALRLDGEAHLGRPGATRNNGSELFRSSFLTGSASAGLGLHF